MKCTEAREYLSEYIDGLLDTQALKGLEEHLLGCAGCREELSLLKALISDMGALEPVHAPEDFLERLHVRMESGFGFGRIMRTLFVPLKIKIPLELATAAVMAVLVFSIWNTQQREPGVMQFPKAQKHERIVKETGPGLPAPSPVEKLSLSKPAFEDSGRSLPEEIPGKFGKESGEVPSKPIGRIKPAKTRPASQETQVKEPPKARREVASEPKADSPSAKKAYRLSGALHKKTAPQLEGKTSPVKLVLFVKADLSGEAPAPCEDLRTSAPPKGTGSIDEKRVLVAPLPKKEVAREEASPETMRTGEPAEERPDRAPSFRRPSPSKDKADSPLSSLNKTFFKVKEVVRLFEGKVFSLEHDKETGQPRALTALIPSANYHSFCEKLERVALLQPPHPTLPEQNQEFVLVRIRFISQ